jgi:transmembrane sensor
MSERHEPLAGALRRVEPRWDEARTERTLAGARHKRVRRQRVRAASATGAAIALVLGVAVLRMESGASTRDVAASTAAERVVSFADGSRAALLDGAAQVVVTAVSDAAVDVSLQSGRARFDVVKRPERRFRVHCDDVVVEVLGTSFELTRDGARTQVRVLRGRVAVRWPSGATELGAGQSGWFPEQRDALARQPHADVASSQVAAPQPAEAPAPNPRATPRERSTPPRVNAQGWRQHAEQGDFGRAFALLDAAHVTDDVEELLLAADAARLSGHAAQAVPYLQRVADRHADDPRAPLAAFTLGGVLLNQLGRPVEAEAAYARARALAPDGSLAQDALARQVEAAHRGDQAARARTLAREYLERYPEGRRAQAVRRFGGLQ